jgi:hypothetical protein
MPGKRAKGERLLEDALAALARALDEAGAPWMVIGGIAVIAHGVRRFTTDIDAAILGDAISIERLLGFGCGMASCEATKAHTRNAFVGSACGDEDHVGLEAGALGLPRLLDRDAGAKGGLHREALPLRQVLLDELLALPLGSSANVARDVL